MLRAVLFDAAGTLIETREPIGASYARIARKYGLETSAEQVNGAFRRAFGKAPPLAFGPNRRPEELRILEKNWWRSCVKESFAGLGHFNDFDAYFAELFEFFADPANWRIDPEGPELLAELRAGGCRLAIVSNFDFRLYRILEALGLAAYFETVVISSEAGYAKPSPAIFRVALGRLETAPVDALHVGDSAHLDLAGALAAGVKTILIDPDLPEYSVISEQTARVRRLKGIPAVIAELPFP